jgi:hypothetical protein
MLGLKMLRQSEYDTLKAVADRLPTVETEIHALRDQVGRMQMALENTKRRMATLHAEPEGEGKANGSSRPPRARRARSTGATAPG